MNNKFSIVSILSALLVVITACVPQEPQIIEITKEVPVEVEIIKEVEVIKEVPVEITPIIPEPQEPLLLAQGPFESVEDFGFIVCLYDPPNMSRAALNIIIAGEVNKFTLENTKFSNDPSCYAFSSYEEEFDYEYWTENGFSYYDIDPADAEYQDYWIVFLNLKP